MPDLYFNPYPGAVTDIETGKQILINTALAVEALRSSIVGAISTGDDIPISAFTLVRDSGMGWQLNFSDLLRSLRGRERDIVLRLYTLFSKGSKLTNEMLCDYEKLTIKGLGLPAPVLEYALVHDGMASSFATELLWKFDFIEFVESQKSLPNIWGQEDLSHIMSWIEEWYQRHNNYIEELKRRFNADVCKGALKSGDLCKTEWDIIFEKTSEARVRNYEVDGYMVKDVETTSYGPMKQIKHLGTGLRLYLSLSGDRIIVGGYYKKGIGPKKGEKLIQGKAIVKARNRINDYYTAEKQKAEEAEAEEARLKLFAAAI